MIRKLLEHPKFNHLVTWHKRVIILVTLLELGLSCWIGLELLTLVEDFYSRNVLTLEETLERTGEILGFPTGWYPEYLNFLDQFPPDSVTREYWSFELDYLCWTLTCQEELLLELAQEVSNFKDKIPFEVDQSLPLSEYLWFNSYRGICRFILVASLSLFVWLWVFYFVEDIPPVKEK